MSRKNVAYVHSLRHVEHGLHLGGDGLMGSWYQFTSIVVEAIGYAEREKTEPPLACPFDGEPLRSSPDGGLFCLLGNYEYPRQRRII